MMLSKLAASGLLVCLLLAPLAHSKQLTFNRSGSEYTYRWQDPQGKIQQLAFSLQKYPRNLSYFSAYRPRNLNRYIAHGLNSYAKKLDPKQARVQIRFRAEKLSWQIMAQSSAKQSQLKTDLRALYQQRYLHYLTQHRFTLFTMPSGVRGLIPNHVQIAKQSAPYLTELAQRFFPKKLPANQIPKQLDTLLSFIQSIPYYTLETRDGYRGAGFMTPIQVLRNNMGDCDSKATLFAATVLSAKLPINIRIVYIPEHAFVAMNIPAQAGQETIEVKNQQWVVADPTGPVLLPFGQVTKRSEHYLKSRYFKTMLISPSP